MPKLKLLASLWLFSACLPGRADTQPLNLAQYANPATGTGEQAIASIANQSDERFLSDDLFPPKPLRYSMIPAHESGSADEVLLTYRKQNKTICIIQTSRNYLVAVQTHQKAIVPDDQVLKTAKILFHNDDFHSELDDANCDFHILNFNDPKRDRPTLWKSGNGWLLFFTFKAPDRRDDWVMMASGPASNVPANRHWFVPLSPEERRKKNKEDDALANRQVYDDVFTFFQSLPEKCDASVPPNLNAEFQPPDGYDWTPLPSPDSSPHRPVYQVRYQTAKEQVVTLRDAPTYQSVQIDRPRPLKTSDETHRYPYYSPVPLLTDAQIVSQLHTLFAHSDQVKAVTKQADASSAQGIFVAQSLDSAWLNGWLWWTDDTGRLLLFHAKGV